MKKNLMSLLIAGAVTVPFAAQAGTLTTANQDITLSGGLAGGYIYNIDSKRDTFTATEAIVGLSSEAKPGGMGFDLGYGVAAGASLASTASMSISATNGSPNTVQYGWLTIMPTDNLKVQAGNLGTNVGYEVVPSYENANILHGIMNANQPANYNGARVTYSMNNMSVYGEVNQNPGVPSAINCTNTPSGNCSGSAVGASGSFGGLDASLSYFNVANGGSIIDIIASTKAGSTTLAANIDYLNKAKVNKSTGTDDNAYGVALYASMPMGDKASLPVRLEYINDGTSGIYGYGASGASNTAITFTVTPTYNFTDATFVRAELAYVTTDKKTSAFRDDKNVATDSNLSVGFQGGVMF